MSVKNTLRELLHRELPYGHPGFVDKTLEQMELYSAKNHDYARSGDPNGAFNRVAAILSLYSLDPKQPETVAFIYLLKQLDCCLSMLGQGYESSVEGFNSRCADIAVYATIASILHEETIGGEQNHG